MLKSAFILSPILNHHLFFIANCIQNLKNKSFLIFPYYNTDQLLSFLFFMRIKQYLEKIDKRKALELIFGVSGIYVTFLIVGILYEKLTSTRYRNTQNYQEQFFRITPGMIMVQRAINWWLGLIYRTVSLPKQNRVKIPTKNSASTGFLIFLSSITQTESMYLVSYPLIIMSKSCSLISVILVGLFCSRVRSKELKLSPQKIIVALIVAAGIIMFRAFDPSSNSDDNKSTQLFGLLLLLISMFSDGFIPDYQAEIKDKFKPSPIQMLIKINKWCAVFSLIYLVLINQVKEFILFCVDHPDFVRDLVLLSLVAFVGQLFIYRMIKEFKQHIVPFVCTTRKIITVGLSLVYFKHETSFGQITAILVVFTVTLYEFIDSIKKTEQNKLGQENAMQIKGVESFVSEVQMTEHSNQMQKNEVIAQ